MWFLSVQAVRLNMLKISELDKWFPPRGECQICGNKDARHRLWDAIINRLETDEFIALDYDLPIEAINAVRRIRP